MTKPKDDVGGATNTEHDTELLEAWRRGDRAAGERLFDRHVASLLRFFRTKAGLQSEELVQRTFLACVRTRDRVRESASFRAYLFTIARNELFRHLGRSCARAFDPLTASIIDLRGSPSDELARDEQNVALLAALCKLPIELQIAVELHYWEELSISELAEVLGIPDGTVKTRLFRARNLLRTHMGENVPIGEGQPFSDIDAWARAMKDDVLPELSMSGRRMP